MDTLLTFFKAMSDETRFRILILLFNHDLCVCELTDILDLSQPKVSKHLSKLRDLGFLKTRRDARFIYYFLAIDHPLIKAMLAMINEKIDLYPCLLKDAQSISQCRRENKLS